MPIEILIKQTGAADVSISLGRAVGRMSDLTPAMKRASVLMIGSVNQNFQRSGRPVPWRPLSPAYLKRKVAQGYSPKPLIRTGLLRASIAEKVSRTGFRVGTSVPYAKYHQLGTSSIPARPYLVFQRQDIEVINQVVLDHLTES